MLFLSVILCICILFVFQQSQTVALGRNNNGKKAKRPHLVFVLCDDLGHGDIHLHDENLYTPTIDSLMKTGIELTRYYTQPVCSPSRAALLQGRFPFRTGLQHEHTIIPTSTAAMPVNQLTIAEVLKSAGYETHMIGKWHLGYAKWANGPTRRGFSSFKGYLQAYVDYLSHEFVTVPGVLPLNVTVSGLDWWEDEAYVKNETGIHTKILYDQRMQSVLRKYAASSSADSSSDSPLFLYYPTQLVHSPFGEIDAKWMKHCPEHLWKYRREYCGMIAALDDSLRLLVEELKNLKMWDNTFLVFSTDNGAMPHVPMLKNNLKDAGLNLPFRAGKGTVFEVC